VSDGAARVESRLAGKVAVVVGGGQTPGETLGNGRASALLYARAGARVVVADRDRESAAETCEMIAEAGGTAEPYQADATVAFECSELTAHCLETFGALDILHNNVGIGAHDSGLTSVGEAHWDAILNVNLKSVLMPCKAVVPIMRERGGGVILNISSVAAIAATRMIAYKTSKAGVNAMTQQLALANARFGIRVNAIMPGLIDTPMAIEGFSAARGVARDVIRAERDERVPLHRDGRPRMGSAWDVAHAALFLVSDESGFVTGVVLPVDGGTSVRIG